MKKAIVIFWIVANVVAIMGWMTVIPGGLIAPLVMSTWLKTLLYMSCGCGAFLSILNLRRWINKL